MKPDTLAYPPRGLGRSEAARYVGTSIDSFDELVKAGAMPKPRQIGRRSVWDRVEIDAYFAGLPEAGGNWGDRMLAEGKQVAGLPK